jgi:hypothetical protein
VPDIPRLVHPKKIHAATAVSSLGKLPLVLFEENLTADGYKDILQEHIVPAANHLYGAQQWTLVQDSDPKHTADSVTGYLQQHGVNFIPRSDWPAGSPDLNPMENVWSMLVDAVNARPPTTLDQLKRVLKRKWSQLPMEKITATIDSMPTRLLAVVEARGGHTKY